MKLILYSLLFLIVLSCSPSTKTEIAADSTSVQPTEVISSYSQSQTPVQYQTPATPFSNFSEYSESLSEDPTESELTLGIQELMTKYDNNQYRTIESYSSCQRDYEGDYGAITETEDITETWFFDASNQLKAFYRKYQRDGEGRDTKVLICLFSNDSLIALTEHRIDDGQIGMLYHTKLLRSKCPDCGMVSSQEGGSSGKVDNYLSEVGLAAFENEFFTTLPKLIGTIGKEWDNATESANGFVVSIRHDEVPEIPGMPEVKARKAYTEDYTISKEIYNKYILKRNWLTAFVKKPLSLSSYTTITNHLKKENIEFTDDIFNGEQLINFEKSQIVVNENSKDLICSAYIESPKIPLSKNIKIGMTEEELIKVVNLSKEDMVTDDQHYFEYTLESKDQSWTVTFTFEKNLLMAVKYEVTPCSLPVD
jgi:hypothetical protein